MNNDTQAPFDKRKIVLTTFSAINFPDLNSDSNMTWRFGVGYRFDANDLKTLFQCGKEKKINFWIRFPEYALLVDKGVLNYKLNDGSQNSWSVVD